MNLESNKSHFPISIGRKIMKVLSHIQVRKLCCAAKFEVQNMFYMRNKKQKNTCTNHDGENELLDMKGPGAYARKHVFDEPG